MERSSPFCQHVPLPLTVPELQHSLASPTASVRVSPGRPMLPPNPSIHPLPALVLSHTTHSTTSCHLHFYSPATHSKVHPHLHAGCSKTILPSASSFAIASSLFLSPLSPSFGHLGFGPLPVSKLRSLLLLALSRSPLQHPKFFSFALFGPFFNHSRRYFENLIPIYAFNIPFYFGISE